MSTVVIRRQPRRPGPELPRGEISLQEPPSLPETLGGDASAVLSLLPMVGGSAATAMVFVQPGAQPMAYMSAGLMGVSSVAMLIGGLGRTGSERKRRLAGERRDYLRYLAQMRRQVRRAAEQQRKALLWNHPDPASLWSLVQTGRLWERRSAHPDFAEVRLATGRQRLALELVPPQTKPLEDLEPMSAHALRRFVEAYRTVPELPIAVNLRGFARVLIDGDGSRDLARAMLAQLATFHSPDDVQIAVCATGERRAEWEWVKWLPHALHHRERDAAGPVRLASESYQALEPLLNDESLTVVVADGVAIPPSARRNVLVLDVSGASGSDRQTLRLRLNDEGLFTVNGAKQVLIGQPDRLSAVKSRALARQMSPYRLSAADQSGGDALGDDIDLTRLLHLGDARTFDANAVWRARAGRDRLRVPIGIGDGGTPVELDIRESAQGGMGPHGMLIGATGSGKSELLRTLILGLAATHSSEVLNLILTDFKGGATFIGFEHLPHTSAVITNLADELPLVDRMQDAINGEMTRRQELLRQAGYSSLLDYERARAAGVPLAPLPTLLIVVDEFSELLSAKRDFIDLFVQIGRLGRSLGVHLLLASQRLDEGRIHALESHLSYRLGLRTFSAGESRSVLGVPDAYELPRVPGVGYLKAGTDSLVRFKAAYVSGPYQPPRERRPEQLGAVRVVPYVTDYLPLKEEAAAPEPVESTSESLLELLIERLRGRGPAAHRIWLPPLDLSPSLDALLPALVPTRHGLAPDNWPHRGGLRVPVGVIDRPFEQRRDLLVADLNGGTGHVGIVGAPQSGKSTLVRTLMTSLALTHSPAEVQFCCLDFGGGTLSAFTGMPHVGSIAGRLDRDRVSRTVAELSALLARREQSFAELGVDSMAAYRRMRAQGTVSDPHGDVFCVVDGWFTFRQDYEHLEQAISDLANRGLSYGIHLVVTASRWSEIRPWLRDLVQTRFELRLGDAIESEVNSRAAANVPDQPGRGLTRDAAHFLVALPRADGSSDADDLAGATRAVVQEIADCWPGPVAPPVRLLPTMLPIAELPAPQGFRVPLGLDELALEPVWHDFDATPHLMVFGDGESGKTNLLRAVCSGVSAMNARVLLADYRRGLYSAVPAAQQLGYAVTGTALTEMITGAAGSLRNRLPGPDITPDRLRARDWWTGPRLFLIVDDYDLVATGLSSPLEPLLELLPQGADIGLHLIVARSTSGASRSMMDPVLRRLWELSTPGVLLSCPPDEGTFLGDVKPRQLPAGRAQFVTRRRSPLLIQTAYTGQ